VTGGRYAGGVQITTPGGTTVNRVGKGGAATGPGGTTAAGRSNITQAIGPGGVATGASRSGAVSGPGGAAAGRAGAISATGPGGTTTAAGRAGAAVGPYGAAAGKAGIAAGPGGAVAGKAGVATGPGGAAAGRAGVATGPGGTVAGRTGVAATPRGTYYRSAAAISGQGAYVRQGFTNYNAFRPGWYARHPGAWLVAGLATGAAWAYASWDSVASTCAYPAEPTYYDYGSSVVYEGDAVYVNGESVGTPEQYAQQAETIADAGREANVAAEGWQALGVFALVQADEQTSYNLFQLAINKDGVLRGNYYNALTDAAEPVVGSVDKKTQRAAWTVGQRKTPVFEAGIANLTKDETTILIHFGEGKTQQWTLVRIEAPKEEPK
jgi:hypothetical protein